MDTIKEANFVLANLDSPYRTAMELRRRGIALGSKLLVVKIAWVRSCVRHNRIEDIRKYTIDMSSTESQSLLSDSPPAAAVKRHRGRPKKLEAESSESESTSMQKRRKKTSSQTAKELSSTESDVPALDAIYMQKLSCSRPHPLVCENEKLSNILKKIRHLRELDGNDIGVRAYSTAIASIRSYPYKIKNAKEIERLPGCGGKIVNLVGEFIQTGKIASETKKYYFPETQAIEQLYKIWGVGGKTASEWVRVKGWKTVEDVRKHGMKFLSKAQKAGLEHYDEFLKE